MPGAGQGDEPALQRLTQGLQGCAIKLGQFVQKQHPQMRQGGLPRAWRHPATHQGHRRGGVVRPTKRPLAPARQLKLPAQALQGRAGQGLVGAHARQQLHKALGQQGFARARRPLQQHAVLTRRRHLQGALGTGLPFDLRPIGLGGLGTGSPCARRQLHPGLIVHRGLAPQVRHHIAQMASTPQRAAGHASGLLCAARWQHPRQRAALMHGMQAHGQGPAHGPQVPSQGQTAGKRAGG